MIFTIHINIILIDVSDKFGEKYLIIFNIGQQFENKGMILIVYVLYIYNIDYM